ncbi:alpha/beta hydrolase [Oceaniglobus ichthyenteri]|uniref:alpha/beta hydrolase n=1 Tax=Oceaniglobus ichthyenteri TaxID=2136177 RepID=UPI000D3BC7F4|nr:alpha/beta hydrolase [Oceaniglobus ichthyenteri]
MKDWDDAFANMAHIPGADALPGIWASDAAAYRDSGVAVDEHRYGDQPRETFDMVWPDGAPKGLAVFVHGGFWIRMDKSHWTHFAQGARANGWAVCMVQYTLAPTARIGQMTAQVGRAITMAAGLVDGPIRLSGHSAGGHLVSRMMCDDSPLSGDVLDRVEHTLSISGLHDLRPLMRTKMNADLRLDEPEARVESAALHRPDPRANLTAWVGGGERPEFIRQAKLLALIWEGLDVPVSCTIDGTHDHFSVLEDLRDPNGAITRAFAP